MFFQYISQFILFIFFFVSIYIFKVAYWDGLVFLSFLLISPVLFFWSNVFRELKEELPAPSMWRCCIPDPSAVTTVHLLKASGLSHPKKTGQTSTVSKLFLRQ